MLFQRVSETDHSRLKLALTVSGNAVPPNAFIEIASPTFLRTSYVVRVTSSGSSQAYLIIGNERIDVLDGDVRPLNRLIHMEDIAPARDNALDYIRFFFGYFKTSSSHRLIEEMPFSTRGVQRHISQPLAFEHELDDGTLVCSGFLLDHGRLSLARLDIWPRGTVSIITMAQGSEFGVVEALLSYGQTCLEDRL